MISRMSFKGLESAGSATEEVAAEHASAKGSAIRYVQHTQSFAGRSAVASVVCCLLEAVQQELQNICSPK